MTPAASITSASAIKEDEGSEFRCCNHVGAAVLIEIPRVDLDTDAGVIIDQMRHILGLPRRVAC